MSTTLHRPPNREIIRWPYLLQAIDRVQLVKPTMTPAAARGLCARDAQRAAPFRLYTNE